MTFQYFGPTHPRNVGAWFSVIAHNSKDGLKASKALELALLRRNAGSLKYNIHQDMRLYTFVFLCFGIVICWRHCVIRQG